MELKFNEKDLETLANLLADKVIEKVKILPQNKPKNDDFLTVPELAKYLKVKESWIYQRVHSREIPYHKIGNKLRFRKSEIDKMVDDL